MFYEREVSSPAGLMRGLRALDQDAGVRLQGRMGGKRFLFFVTRFGPKYTLMVYTMGRDGSPGRKVWTSEFDDVEALGRALKERVPGRLRAWFY